MHPAGARDAIDPEVERLLMARQKIQAIKFVRERKGLGLKEAKDTSKPWADACRPAHCRHRCRLASEPGFFF